MICIVYCIGLLYWHFRDTSGKELTIFTSSEYDVCGIQSMHFLPQLILDYWEIKLVSYFLAFFYAVYLGFFNSINSFLVFLGELCRQNAIIECRSGKHGKKAPLLWKPKRQNSCANIFSIRNIYADIINGK